MQDRAFSKFQSVSFETLETRCHLSASATATPAYATTGGEFAIFVPLARSIDRGAVGPVINIPGTLPTPTIYEAPIRITQGGTYSGNWQSLDRNTPAILIMTDEPVVIENSNIMARGELIASYVSGADITIRNTVGTGLNSMVAGTTTGRFLHAEGFKRVVIENNEMNGTAGIYLADYSGNGTASESIRVVGNIAKNIDGRQSNGAGGYLADGWESRQFVQLNRVRHLAGVEIAWNQVINEPGKSRVEDNISIHLSSGTADSPIRIHDNYIDGAYPTNAAGDSYSGGGIMLSDGSSSSVDDAVSYVHAYNNQVIATTNYGIAISSGHNNAFYGNRIIASGRLDDGTIISAQNVGAYVWDMNGDATRGTFFNNVAYDNFIRWGTPANGATATNNYWMPDAAAAYNNTTEPGRITTETEAAEWTYWQDKLAATEISIGVMPR